MDAYPSDLLLLVYRINKDYPNLTKRKILEEINQFSTVVKKVKDGPPKKMIYSNFYKIENIGKEWLARNNYDNAISVFKINTDVFDWIAGPFDNLAHAYMLDGQYEMAVKNYNKVLEIRPDDKNATTQLQQISVLKSKSEE